MSNQNHLERAATIEIGLSEALQKHITRHVASPPPVSQRKLDFEHRRPRLLREMMAEATGVFFYVFCGISSVASFTLSTTNGLGKEIGVPVFGSLFQIGFAFAFGIAFAIITCASVSGGHFNPAITIAFVVFQKFPIKKAACYIFAQIFGSFMAGMLVMGCYWPEIKAAHAIDIAQHGTAVYNGGVASILCSFPNPDQTNQGFLFFQEFFVDSCIGIVIWSCLDPANPFMAPTAAPWTIGLAYATMVWGFAGNTISTNLARDLGTRIVAAIFFGGEAFSYLNYSWISILVNVPATLFAICYYEILIRDSMQRIHGGHAEHEDGEDGLVRHLTNIQDTDQGMVNAAIKRTNTNTKYEGEV